MAATLELTDGLLENNQRRFPWVWLGFILGSSINRRPGVPESIGMGMDHTFKLIATSHPDDDRMLVEIYVDGEHLAELVEAPDDHLCVLYPRRGGKPWILPRGFLVEAIAAAASRLDALILPGA